MTLAPSRTRYETYRSEAVRREASAFMTTVREKLDSRAVLTRLDETWRSFAWQESDVAFVDDVRRQIATQWSSHARHLAWFDENIVAAREDGYVQETAEAIVETPLEDLTKPLVDEWLRKAWRLHTSDDTLIAFVDRVIARVRDGWTFHADHVAWLRANFVTGRAVS